MDQADLERLIADGVEENLRLEYKGAESIDRTDSRKREITKDVSAMANSDGGRLIYGIKEFQDAERRHLPERLDPVDRTTFSREWLEQVIGTIQPRIRDLSIHPVAVNGSTRDVVYVIDIPKATTAHQARDHKYYKRHDFSAVSMEDYEIRDVMARGAHPLIEVVGAVEDREFGGVSLPHLVLDASNVGTRLAQFYVCFFQVPVRILALGAEEKLETIERDGEEFVSCHERNTRRDVIGVGGSHPYTYHRYGPTWFDPLLPGLRARLKSFPLKQVLSQAELARLPITWEVYADNAPVQSGEWPISQSEDIG